jgi:hypothetical protein
MKKFFSIVLFVMILISSLSFTPNSFGAVSLVSASDQTYSPVDRTDLENKINNFIQINLDNRAASFTLYLSGDYIMNTYNFININTEPLFSPDMVHNYRFKAGNDYNAIAFLGSEYGNAILIEPGIETINGKTSKIILAYTVNWGETATQRTAVESFAQSKVNELGVSSMNDFDKVKTLHDFVVNYASYDFTEKNAYPYQIISSKTGICQAYAGLFYMLCKKANVDTRIVIKGDGYDTSKGKTSKGTIDHAWNLVKVNGNWYHVDTTWDDPIHNEFDILQWKYFLKSDSTMTLTPATANSGVTQHFWDKNGNYPSAYSDYPTNLTDYVATPKGSAIPSSKPKITPVSSTSKKTSSANAVTSSSSVSSLQSIISSESAVSSEMSSTESSETVAITTQNTNFYSGLENFFVGGMGKLYTNNKPLFIVAIIGFAVVVILITTVFIFFLRRRKRNNMPSPFGGGSFS